MSLNLDPIYEESPILYPSFRDGWILLYMISSGVSWIVGISFPEWAVRADVRVSQFFPKCCRVFLAVVY